MKSIIAILLFILFFSRNVYSALRLNEIYPAPLSGEYEWVEVYNDENSAIDLSQYSLFDLTNKKIKFINTTLPPLGFEIATSSGVLNNDGDSVFLKNDLGEIIEIATYSASFDLNKTFAKCSNGNGNWFVLNISTKNVSNETACQILTPTILILTSIITPIPTETSTPSPQSYDNIYISEVMANPVTGEKEWVEIFNNNDFPVYLDDWYLDDLENGGSSPKIFSLEITAKGYGIFDLASSIFNNDGDSVRLLDFNKNLKDDFEYKGTEQGKILGRISFDSNDFCLQEPSKNYVNNPCINPIATITPTLSVIAGSSTKNVIASKTPINRGLINKPPTTPVNFYAINPTPNTISSNVLGTSTIINPNNSLLINLLSFLSFSYSLLTIISILFKMKLGYGKSQNFYSSSFNSP